MPRFISKDGVWYPAKEKVSLHKDGEPYIYEGKDRAAEFELFKAGVKNFGMDFHQDPDLINRARQLGYKSVDAYAKAMGYDKKKADADFEEKAAVIVKHEPPERKEAVEVIGGGRDLTGGGEDRLGGFGKETAERRPKR